MKRDAPPRVVLIVDDDPIVRESLARIFEDGAYTPVHADSGLHALELLRSLCVDAVIADLNMPGMDGIRFLVYVRDMFPECARVLLTGSGSATVEQNALALAGIRREQVLRKGVSPEELRRTVEVALPRAAQGRDSSF